MLFNANHRFALRAAFSRSLVRCWRLTSILCICGGLVSSACVQATAYEQVSSAEEVEAESHRRTVEAYRKLLAQKQALEKANAFTGVQLKKERKKSSKLINDQEKSQQEIAQVKVDEAKAQAAHKAISSELSLSSSELAKTQSQAADLSAQLQDAKAQIRTQEDENKKLLQSAEKARQHAQELEAELNLMRLEILKLKKKPSLPAEAKAAPKAP